MVLWCCPALSSAGQLTPSLLMEAERSGLEPRLDISIISKMWRAVDGIIIYNTKEARCRVRFQFVSQAPSGAISLPVKGSVC